MSIPGSIVVRSKDGTPIEAVVSGDGPPLVLVHGTSGDATRWPSVIPALSERFKVFAMHRRGRGGSIDGDAPYAIEREGEDIAALVAAIGAQVSVLGHSYGGLCLLEALLASGMRERVARVMFYEPPVPIGRPVYPAGLPERIETLVAAGDREAAVTMFFREVFLVKERELAFMRDFPSWAGRLAAAHTLAREIRATDGWSWNAARFAHLDAPARLLVGAASAPIAHEMTDCLASGLHGSDIVLLEGQQHVAMDTAPDLFVREVALFLEPQR